jgi:hypothetical protein
MLGKAKGRMGAVKDKAMEGTERTSIKGSRREWKRNSRRRRIPRKNQ